MKLGLQISSFTWPGGDAAIGDTLARAAPTADDAGFDSIWVMDHLFQIRSVGQVEEPMLEGTTALGFMAAHTTRARLGLMVGAVPYRYPGVWIKSVTTLDVLSGHCEDVGRDYDEIERTNLSTISITLDGSRGSLTPAAFVERLGGWADA